MKNADMNKVMTKAMSDFADAYDRLVTTIERYERETNTSINDLKGFVDDYPFEKSFDELTIRPWVDSVTESLQPMKFKVLSFQYLNTGGNTMVGIFDVWLPEENRVVYALANEEGCSLSVVDYISNDLEVDDYSEFIFDYCDYGRLTGHEKYFELYRLCLNEFLYKDCKYFGYTRDVPWHLLSDALQAQITDDYFRYLETERDLMVTTNGKDIIVDPDYEEPADEDNELEQIKEFKRWHDTIAGEEKYYDSKYKLTIAGHEVELPFFADVWNAVDEALESMIENW